MKTDTIDKETPLTRKDFKTDQAVRWCPGCGDYMILANMQKAFAQMDHAKENNLSVSGIGCSSRITYYLETFGIHSVHGRALPVATGAKLANPDLNVWVFSGDGDSMAIGGNHFIHACRRNVDLNLVIFNNKIYGMTKGQSSPTTPAGVKTKTAPEGNYENPFNIGEIAIGAGATFYARVPDNDPKMMEEAMMQAYNHKGFSVIEVLQNCVIFTDGIHEKITGRDTKDEHQVVLEEGEPIVFGNDKEFGLKVEGMKLNKMTLEDEIGGSLVHDPTDDDTIFHLALARMQLPNFPVATGIIRKVEKPSFEREVHQAIVDAKERSDFQSVHDLIRSGNTWDIV